MPAPGRTNGGFLLRSDIGFFLGLGSCLLLRPDGGFPVDPESGFPLRPDSSFFLGSGSCLLLRPDGGFPVDPESGFPLRPGQQLLPGLWQLPAAAPRRRLPRMWTRRAASRCALAAASSWALALATACCWARTAASCCALAAVLALRELESPRVIRFLIPETIIW